MVMPFYAIGNEKWMSTQNKNLDLAWADYPNPNSAPDASSGHVGGAADDDSSYSSSARSIFTRRAAASSWNSS
jgi:hypothetical protein